MSGLKVEELRFKFMKFNSGDIQLKPQDST